MHRFASRCLCALGLTLLWWYATPVFGAAPLRIGVERYDKPISFLDAAGQPTGFSADLIAAMREEGLGETIVVADWWSSLLAKFRAGELDVLANVYAVEMKQDMDFSISHLYLHGVVYTPLNRPAIIDEAHFSGKTIAAVRGSMAWSNALANAGWGAKIIAFKTPEDAVGALRRGECDGLLQVHALDQKYPIMRSPDLRREILWGITHHLCFAVHKGDAASLERVNSALAGVIRSNRLDEIAKRWFGAELSPPLRWQDLRPYLVPFLAVALLGIGVIALLLRQTSRLKQSEALFANVIDSSALAWVIHRNGMIVLANPLAAEVSGISQQDLIGVKLIDLIAPPAKATAAIEIPAERGVPWETTIFRPDGTPLTLEVVGRDCIFQGKPARLVSMRDITAVKQAAADQLTLSKLESTGLLAGGVAHDFNNFLATIGLNLDLVLASPSEPAQNLTRLQMAKLTTQAAKALTAQLLTFSRTEISRPVPVRLTALLSRTAPIPLMGSNVRAEVVAEPSLWVTQVDILEIERVLYNLLLNAREAMPAGGLIRIKAGNVTLASETIHGLAAGPYVHLEVIDQGHGIPADQLPKIFDPYFSTKQRDMKKGMGLGLTICHRIITQHGGAITVQSKPGAGTTFHVYLPASPELPAPAEKPAAAPARAPTPGAIARRVLVMDDEVMLLETLRMTLTFFGYEVETVSDGAAAIAEFARAQSEMRPFHVVMLDHTVRGNLGGLETVAALRQMDPNLRAVLISGHAEQVFLREYARYGFAAALSKPFEIDELRDVLAKLS